MSHHPRTTDLVLLLHGPSGEDGYLPEGEKRPQLNGDSAYENRGVKAVAQKSPRSTRYAGMGPNDATQCMDNEICKDGRVRGVPKGRHMGFYYSFALLTVR